ETLGYGHTQREEDAEIGGHKNFFCLRDFCDWLFSGGLSVAPGSDPAFGITGPRSRGLGKIVIKRRALPLMYLVPRAFTGLFFFIFALQKSHNRAILHFRIYGSLVVSAN